MFFRRSVIAICAAFSMAGPALSRPDIIIGTDKPGGSYYLYGGGIANWLNRSGKFRATAETTRGSVENARLLHSGRITFGLLNGTIVYQQRTGTDQFQNQRSEKLRGVAVLDMAALHIVTFAGKGISKLEDLAGKKVSIGAPGSGTANSANTLFTATGLKEKVQIQSLGFDESAANLRDGNLDAFFVFSALPVPSVVDLASNRDVVLLPVSAANVSTMQKASPAYQPFTIPANTYRGINQNIETVAVPTLLATRADVPDSVVSDFLEQVYSKDSIAYMKGVYSAWEPTPGKKVHEDIGVPLHPAAERFYSARPELK